MSIQVPPFPGLQQSITLPEAISMTTDYRGNNEKILDPLFQHKDILPYSETFNREVFDAVLAQPNCQGLRLYYSMDNKMKVHIIVVAVNSLNEDILSDGDSLIIEKGTRCPALCPPSSPLNS